MQAARILLAAMLLAGGSAGARSMREPRPPVTEYGAEAPVQAPIGPAPPAITSEFAPAGAASLVAPPVAPPIAEAGLPPSACAALPASGFVPRPAAAVAVPARPTPEHGWHCDAPFRLDTAGRLPQCVRPGIRAVDGNPREMCQAAMPFGPIAAVAPRSRPTRSCIPAQAETVVRLEGPNLGWGDVTITAVPDRGVVITTLADTGDSVAEAENPVLQGCFAFQCRLVKLAIDGTAAPQIELRASLPGHDYEAVTIKLPVFCPH